MRNKFNIPIYINIDKIEGNYIDHYNYEYYNIKETHKRRIITDIEELISFGIYLRIINDENS